MKSLPFFLFLLLLPFALFSQEGYRTDLYTTTHGLPSSQLHRVYQDSRDFLWVGTSSGLSKFDGHSFKNYSLLDGLEGSQIMEITEDWKGNMWIGTSSGLFRYNGKHFRRLAYDFLDITDILPEEDTLWITTKTGLIKLDLVSLELRAYNEKHGLISNVASGVLRTRDGRLLVSTRMGISEFTGMGFRDYWNPGEANYVLAMGEDAERRIWFSTLNNEIYCSRQLQPPAGDTDNPLHPDPPVLMLNNKEGEFMIGYTRFFDVYRNGRFHRRMHLFEPNENHMFNGLQDREGNYWLATARGLAGLRRTFVKEFHTPPIENPGLFRIPQEQAVYFTTCQDIFQIRGDSLIPVLKGKPVQLGCVEVLAKSNDAWLAGTRYGDVQLAAKGRFTQVSDKIVFNAVNDGERVWIGGGNHLLLYEHDSIKEFPFISHRPYLLKFQGLCLLPGRNRLLLGSQRGPYEFNNGKLKELLIPGIDKRFYVSEVRDYGDSVYLLATRGYGLMVVR
ncbi:MAG: hypothetical protein EOP49_18200, partial [Sphingobacteriales bacterium]